MADNYIEAFGNLPSSYDVRDYKIEALKDIIFPETFHIDPPPVKNQFMSGTCTAFSASEIVEYHHELQTKEQVEFSTEYIYGNRFEKGDYTGEGLSVRRALETLYNYGDPTALDCSGNNGVETAMEHVSKDFDSLAEKAAPMKITGYARVEGTEAIKTALYTCGPVLISLNWYDKYSVDKKGILHFTKTSDYGAHAVILYGWNENGWLLQNSWGVFFGKGGRCTLPFDEKINEAWCVYDNSVEGLVHKGSQNGLIKILSKVLNWIVNLVTSLVK